jgi:hypothetical protein
MMFTWRGPLDDERWAILDGWAQIAAFRAATQAIRAAADAREIERPLPPARPLPSELPPELRGRLGIEETRLTWQGPAPTDAERAALADLVGDTDFLDARMRLLGAIDTRREVPLPPEEVPAGQPPRRPRPEDLPPVLQGRLVIGTSTLAWTPPAPTDAERAALRALTGDPAFEAARDALLAAIDADQAVTMTAVPRRPRPADVPPLLAAQLTIEPMRLRWTGQLHNQAQRQALMNLHGDPPFDAAIASLVAALDTQAFTVSFDSPVRPAQAQLGPLLSGKLLIGRALLRHHGLLARSEAVLLAGAFAPELDMRAVTRLYRQSQANAHRGRTLKLRARRGAAAPTPFVDLTLLDPL